MITACIETHLTYFCLSFKGKSFPFPMHLRCSEGVTSSETQYDKRCRSRSDTSHGASVDSRNWNMEPDLWNVPVPDPLWSDFIITGKRRETRYQLNGFHSSSRLYVNKLRAWIRWWILSDQAIVIMFWSLFPPWQIIAAPPSCLLPVILREKPNIIPVPESSRDPQERQSSVPLPRILTASMILGQLDASGERSGMNIALLSKFLMPCN